MKYAYVYDGSKHELKEFQDPMPEQKEVEKTRIVQVEELDNEGNPVTIDKEETYTETESYQPEFNFKEIEDKYESCVWLTEEEYNHFKNVDVSKYHLEWNDEHKPVLAEYGKQQWVEIKDGKIIASAGYRFSETCIKASEDIERGYDGGLYKKSELPTPPIEYQNEQIRQQRQARFTQESDPLKLDYDEAVARGDEEKIEETKQAWLAKKDEIREELPYITIEDTEE